MKRSASDDEAEEEAEVEEKPSKAKKPAAAAAKDGEPPTTALQTAPDGLSDKSSKKAKKAPTEDAVFNIGKPLLPPLSSSPVPAPSAAAVAQFASSALQAGQGR